MHIKNTKEKPTLKIPLAPLESDPEKHVHAFNYNLPDYLELVDWTGRAIRDDKRGSIPENLPSILHRLNLDPSHFLASMKTEKRKLSNPIAIGSVQSLKQFAQKTGRKIIQRIPLFTPSYP